MRLSSVACLVKVAEMGIGGDAGCRVDQLPGDAHPVAGFAHATFEHVAHTEVLSIIMADSPGSIGSCCG